MQTNEQVDQMSELMQLQKVIEDSRGRADNLEPDSSRHVCRLVERDAAGQYKSK